MTTLDVYGLGVRTHVHVGGERADELADAVRAAWSRCLEPTPGAIDGGVVRAELLAEGEARAGDPRNRDAGRAVVRGGDRLSLMQALTQAVTAANIAAQTGRLLMLHAGAVCDAASGATVGFVAPGGTGKTTLARALGGRWGYVTDETLGVRLDDRGVVAYPKPLSVRLDGSGTKRELSPDALGLRRPGPELWLRRLVLIQRDQSVRTPHVEELGVMDALVGLTPETSALGRLPRPLHALADLLDALGPTLRVTYAEASGAAPVVADLMGAA